MLSKKNYMQRKCQTMKNILMVLFKHDNYSQERCFKKIQGQNVYSYIALWYKIFSDKYPRILSDIYSMFLSENNDTSIQTQCPKNILGYYLRIEIDEHCQRKEICEGKNI